MTSAGGTVLRICAGERRAYLGDRLLALGSRAYDLLAYLVEHRDRVVSRHELFDAAWPGAFVEESNLSVQVAALRRELDPSWIVTVSGRGYRFTGKLEASEPMAAPMVWRSVSCVADEIDKAAIAALVSELAEWDECVWSCDLKAAGASLDELLVRVRHAVAWSLSPGGDPTIGLELLGRSRWLWETLNLAREGSTHLAALEGACLPSVDCAIQSRYWNARAFLNIGIGFHRELPRFAARAVAWARVGGDRRLLFESLTTLAILCVRCGNLVLADAALAEALDAEDAHFPPRLRAIRRFASAEFYEAEGRFDLARRSQNERLALLREAGAWSTELHARAQILAYDTAEGHAEESAAEASSLLDRLGMCLPPFRGRVLHLVLAEASLALQRCNEAHDALRAALPLMSGASAEWQTLDLLARVWALRNDWALAAQLQSVSDECHVSKGMARKPQAARQRQRLVDRCGLVGARPPALSISEALALAFGPNDGTGS